MNKLLTIPLTCILYFSVGKLTAQDSSKIFFTTGIGIIKSPGSLHHVFHPSLAFNSAIELVNKQQWFLQGSVDFNTLKYNQHVKEGNSPFLFQNTSSSLIMLAVSAGKNFRLGNNKWMASVYTGGGYLNNGEPRIISINENILRQEVSRKSGIFGKAGLRIGYKTRSKFLQTIYFDGAWWRSPLKVQGATLGGVSLFTGIRMAF